MCGDFADLALEPSLQAPSALMAASSGNVDSRECALAHVNMFLFCFYFILINVSTHVPIGKENWYLYNNHTIITIKLTIRVPPISPICMLLSSLFQERA
jgi:hypothetical protein